MLLNSFDPSASGQIICEISRQSQRIQADFELREIQDLFLSRVNASAPLGSRIDELWRHTCFELFISSSGQESYLEINASPFGDWNAYLFDGYRKGMRTAPVGSVQIEPDAQLSAITLKADLNAIPFLQKSEAWEIGIASVLCRLPPARTEYWALAHPAPQPDFHARGAFLVHV